MYCNIFHFSVTYKMLLPSNDQGGIPPQGTFVPSSAACVSHCSIFPSSKWVRNLSFASSCGLIPNYIWRYPVHRYPLFCPAALCLPCMAGLLHTSRCRASPLAGSALLSLCGQNEQGHHASVAALPRLKCLLAKGLREGVGTKAGQLLRRECAVAGEGAVPRQLFQLGWS